MRRQSEKRPQSAVSVLLATNAQSELRYKNVQVALGKQPVHGEPFLALFGRDSELVIVACNVVSAIVLDIAGRVSLTGSSDGRNDSRQNGILAHLVLQRAQL